MINWKRTLRTASSECFLATREGKDVAAVDLHYLANGTVSGTVILLKNAGWKEDDIPKLLQALDEDFLPDVDLGHGSSPKPLSWPKSLAIRKPLPPPHEHTLFQTAPRARLGRRSAPRQLLHGVDGRRGVAHGVGRAVDHRVVRAIAGQSSTMA